MVTLNIEKHMNTRTISKFRNFHVGHVVSFGDRIVIVAVVGVEKLCKGYGRN